ncbi:alpha-1 2-mannosidase [Actinorhabdospora filicis]|uniref:Alpha-1 2-mannosidase n=1 Tax=Actinorhabdospora filicis TaxID=1785913 RepID=A0A9W6SE71_9ACTN|nr:GH92 family glycosyl hydrolase [Actinorhabdospora filicis]GLZ75584.1 alpha-1 2-mannosidase [Actinorhabdospora filicis]
MNRKHRPRWTVPATVLITIASTLIPAQAAAERGTEFATSFEAGQPGPDWTSTVETGPDGRPMAHGVDGNLRTGIPGNVMDTVVAVTASGEYPESGEVKENLTDGDPASKWLTFTPTAWAAVELSAPVTVVHYALTSANDAPERDPRDWTLQGSEDGAAWVDLDRRAGEEFTERFQTKEYRYAGTTPYRHYRLDVTRNGGAGIVQLGELQLSNGDDTPPPPTDMRSVLAGGPRSAPAAKARVGYTGLRSLEFAGRHLAEGRAYSYNKVLDVDVTVMASTELSYLMFVSATEGDLRNPGTYASVDLAFADGTYLSQLGAVDQHGVRLDPVSQGRSKTLSVNQWNHTSARIGLVAAGKRISRILVAYDNPEGPPTGFRNFLDDVSIVGAPPVETRIAPSDWVLTTRGTQSSGSFSRGNNLPATAVPHGFNFYTPVTSAGSLSWLYEYHRANDANNRTALQALSVSHQPSPWMGDRQTFQVMPSAAAGAPPADRRARALPFGHDKETARAHYYGVEFDNGLKAEIAPADHAAVFRFTYPGTDASLVFDNVNNGGGLTLDGRVLTAYSDVRSGLSAGATRLFVYAVFDRPVVSRGMLPGGGGPDVTGYLRFAPGADRTVTMRLATSLISVDQARRNLESEVGGASFDQVRDAAKAAWDAKLGIVTVEGATPDQLTTLYSNMYRLFLYPNSGHENTGTPAAPVYRHASPFAPKTGTDTPTSTGAAVVDGTMYVNNGFWDTYRTTWPAYNLLTPTQSGAMIDGFLRQYQEGGWVSRWSSPGYANLMTGTSSDAAFADALLKGVPGFDAETAYDAAVKNATVAPTSAAVGRKGLETSAFRGYTSTDTPEGFSWAMEGYANDAAIAAMAKALYLRDPAGPRAGRYLADAAYFRGRAQEYVNLFDASTGFFQGRDADGKWRVPAGDFDPAVWGYDYTETNAWNMAFTVPQDGRGLAALYGGPRGLGEKLDAFFATPETGSPDNTGSYGGVIHEMTEARDVRMGMYGHSNQPSHHIPYMYLFSDRPWKTQATVREVTSRLYLGSEIGQGYPGDEDNGEMSAWWLFSALGFYPLQHGTGTYAIGSPLFTKATVHLENGRDLVINAPRNSARNVYVQGLRVNGLKWDATWLPHAALAAGGVLDFDMGSSPSRWGTGPHAAPPSLSDGDVPSPPRDVSGDGRVSHPELFDDTSVTQFVSEGPFTVTADLPERARVEMYTLTSAAGPGDPTGWRVLASRDGRKWTVIDRREGEDFAWRDQTRAFRVEDPGKYAHYRIEFTGSGRLGLSEIELLA